jgi:DNA topoisomerase-2
VKGHQIKNHLAVFVNALIENPAFDSQTKETFTTRCANDNYIYIYNVNYIYLLPVHPPTSPDSHAQKTPNTHSPSAFGMGCNVSDKFLKQVEKSGVVDNVVNWAKFKQCVDGWMAYIFRLLLGIDGVFLNGFVCCL